MIMECGLGDALGSFQHKDKVSIQHFAASDVHQRQAENWMEEAYKLALDTLEGEKNWLIHMADFLSDIPKAGPLELKQIAIPYAEEFQIEELAIDKDQQYYREKLKSLLEEVNEGVLECLNQDWIYLSPQPRFLN